MSTVLSAPSAIAGPLRELALGLETPSQPPPPPRLPVDWTLADLQQYLGDIPPHRIRLFPAPGTATEADALAVHDRGGPICELVDGILVEKDMATFESFIAGLLIRWIGIYLDQHPIGILLCPDGTLRILPRRVRVPDVSVILWEKFPEKRLPQDAIYAVAPDLAVEVLSPGNSPSEMEIKRQEYLEAGVRLIWYLDPRERTATVYRVDGSVEELDATGTLDGGDVLPGFSVSLAKLFSELDRVGPAAP